MTTLALLGNKFLRTAIRRNLVSFPAQAPVFAKLQTGAAQARISQLYFVAGWSIQDIGKRYTMSAERVRKSLTDWRVRAISSGYIQEIGPDPLPGLAAPDASQDSQDDDADRTRASEPVRPPAQVVPIQWQSVMRKDVDSIPAGRPDRISVLHLLLEDLEAGLEQARWDPFRIRLLQILKTVCMQSGLVLSTIQAERIQAALETQPDETRELIRDLRNRITDEERCSDALSRPDASLLYLLLSEIETAVRERIGGAIHYPPNQSYMPRHGERLLAVLNQGCSELGMEFSLAQIRRIKGALTTDPERLTDLLRDLRNRFADEQAHTTLICVSDHGSRQLNVGSGR